MKRNMISPSNEFGPQKGTRLSGSFCLLCLLAADYGLRRFRADANGNDHRNVFLITSILVAMRIHEISFFELYRQQDVSRGSDREDEMRHSHRGCGPEREQPSQVQWVTHVPIEQRRPEF